MITVEDFNSVLYEFGGSNIYHCVDTALISDEYDFDGIKYDFCIVDKENTDTDEYTYYVEVVNDCWTGGYYILNSSNEYVDDATVSYSSGTGVITIVTDQPSIKLYLYLINVAHSFQFERLSYILLNNKVQGLASNRKTTLTNPFLRFKLLDGSMPETLVMTTPDSETGSVTTVVDPDIADEYTSNRVRNWFYQGGMMLTYSGANRLYFLNELVTVELPMSIAGGSLVKGKVNNVALNLDKGEYSIVKGTAYCNNDVVDFNISGDDVSFDLDLSDYYKDFVSLTVFLHPNSEWFGWVYDLRVPVLNTRVLDEDGLISECGTGGAGILELGSDITLTGDVSITHDVIIIGNGYGIDCDGHSLIVREGVKLSLSDCSLSDGDNAIVQKADSELVLDKVSFTHCVSGEYSNLGACIFCDIDLESLEDSDDFKTTLTDCEFYDNQSAILHGGNLTVTGCKLHNTSLTYMDKHNVAFLYQTDGNATIRDCILDIDYTDTALCTGEESIGFAQCLFKCGETASLNGVSYEGLKGNDRFATGFGNACHIFAKYYYGGLSECVFTSPTVGNEDKALCYCVTGVNKVFKQNVQITRASDGNENTTRKIEW